METKRCSGKGSCDQVKPLSDFHIENGYRWKICKSCRSERLSQQYIKRTAGTNVKRYSKSKRHSGLIIGVAQAIENYFKTDERYQVA